MSSTPLLSSAPKVRRRLAPACGRSALDRIIRIHARLGNEQLVTAVSLARECEVSDRTIKRDIECMRDRMGVPIAWDATTHSYYYTHRCDLLPLLRLDADEALALVLANRTFSAWSGSPLGRALTVALEKIAPVVGGAVSFPAEALKEFIFQPEETPEVEAEHRWFAVALEAIQRRRELQISYQKPKSGAAETRTIHPLHLAFLDHRWVLVAYDPNRSAPRNFLLTRIRKAESTGTRFTPPADFDLGNYLRGSLGRFTGDQDHVVRIAFDTAVAPYIREKPWHPSQTITTRSDGAIEVTLRLNNLIDVERRILACGAHAEVLAPAELRETIRLAAAAMLARHVGSGVGPSLADAPLPSRKGRANRPR
ncbi:MAG TPA: WYL domain-containing protein [Opitutus sp.]|nr:WYL domain-containing protein [Opitutus sp.]